MEPFPDGGVLIVPAGPYTDGQQVDVLADSATLIDLANSSPRLCARVDGAEEICDPTWIRPKLISAAPTGTHGVKIELPRTHFGPTGDRDCADAEVVCRLLWLTESDGLLMSDKLVFHGPVAPIAATLEATISDRPGEITLTAGGVNATLAPDELFSPAQLALIEDDVSPQTEFDSANLEIFWRSGGLCGFGPGDPPIGSENLQDPPAWWAPATLDPSVYPVEARFFFGATCDQLASGRPAEVSSNEPLTLTVSRNIYGFGGWIDCADAVCWLELRASWRYPMPDGSTVGSDVYSARVLVDVPVEWPSIKPSIQVVEPGPYLPGQRVTVEVRNHPLRSDGLAIGWCPGGADSCEYKFSTYADGVHHVTWTIPAGSSDCGPSRCYFAIESPSEGLGPPAITIVAIAHN